MVRPSDTREVLIAEALGDFVKVLDRIDAVKPMLEKSCSDLKFTAERLLGNIEPFQKHILAQAIEIQNRTLGNVVKQANLAIRNSVDGEIRAMQESARRVFNDEVEPPLHRVAAALRAANLRKEPAWTAWLTHASAAICAASCTCLLMLLFTPTGAAQTQAVTNAPPPGCAQPAPPPVRARDRR